jgi:hypothetical protein
MSSGTTTCTIQNNYQVMEDGEVLVDWAAVKKARNAFEP